MDNLSSVANESLTVSKKDIPSIYKVALEDANWIMTSAFIIFTMQTGKFHLV